ncbi:EamA family transporter RarD [Paenibacillus sp. ACRRX]|uniref:EamA family transporter RarD n=1 Tax=unclassified Paenibacillus TaxID=185978 RepID=UPI001EF456D0|nr:MULTISPECIES: EamA family transporter RarD [unclassified Paenibacillus]MCG7406904.1 EamA family transporter RarD [Paenibacillus sp. ACRRX]MDK8179837.1 EamA family transporter RarD [Paenibacillus sp. UMB4589-SE434]
MNMKQSPYSMGVLATGLSYLMWGVLPIYWKSIGSVPAEEVLAHRIVWSLVFMVVVLLAAGKLKGVTAEIKAVFTDKRQATSMILAAMLISVNWLVFIFAVKSDHVLEASMGYYINPLLNVFLATFFLKERLNKIEWASVVIAGVGVLCLTVYYGRFPWAALTLAATFSFYGLIKKKVGVGAWAGLTIETLIIAPFALIFLLFFDHSGVSMWDQDMSTILLLMGTGIVTAIPLLLFAAGARRISFTLVGFLQYIAPTIMLLLGLFLFHEPFSQPQLFAFILIWLALLLFSVSRSREMLRRKAESRLNAQ